MENGRSRNQSASKFKKTKQHSRRIINMKNKKIASMAALLVASMGAAQAQTITSWTFANDAIGITPNPAPLIGTGTASALGMNNTYNGTSVSTPDVLADAGSSSGSPNAWRVRGVPGTAPGNGWSYSAPIATQGAEFAASTAGYTGIQISFDLHTTAQAEANLAVLYTTDGVSWQDATLSYGGAGATVLNNTTSANTIMGSYIQFQNTAAPWYNGITANLGGVSAVNNDPNFAIEIVNASTGADDINQAGALYNNTSGNWRYGNVVISGVAVVPEPSTLALAGFLGFGALVGFNRLKNRRS
jgi:hypothetical protein